MDAGNIRHLLELRAMGSELDEFAADSSGAANSPVDGSRKPDAVAGEPCRKWIQQSTGLRAVVVRLRESGGGDQEPGGCRRSSVAPVVIRRGRHRLRHGVPLS